MKKIFSRVLISYILMWPTSFGYPIPVVLSYMPCPRCPVLAVLSWLSSPGCPFLDPFSWLSLLTVMFYQPVLAVLSWFSFYCCLPSCPVLAVFSRLSCSGRPGCPVLAAPSCPVLAVLSWLSSPGCSLLVVLSLSSYLGSPVLADLFWLSSFGCPLLAVLCWLSFACCLLGCPSLLSCPILPGRPGSIFMASPSYCSWVFPSCPGSPVLAILSWQFFPGCPVLLAVLLFCFSSKFVGETATQLKWISATRAWSQFKKCFFFSIILAAWLWPQFFCGMPISGKVQ